MTRILIVDDDEGIREIVREALSSAEGYEFYLAADGPQALDILRKKSVDLAIVDRSMPGMSGIEVVQQIRSNPKTASLKVLMCTGASMTKEVDQAFAAGADDYVLKPLNFEHLAAKVAKILALPPRPA